MAVYNPNHKSINYRFTVTDQRDKDLLDLRAVVNERNKYARKFERVSRLKIGLKARGKRAENAIRDGLRPRAYDQHLPWRYASYFDVYVYEVTK